jgi:signal transduction histidine kinase
VLAGKVWRGEVVNRRKDGNLYTEEMTITPVRDAAGEIVRFICIKEDITERKRAEQERAALEVQLRQAQKLEAIGQLAAGIAHEINTPTQYIGDNLHFVQDAIHDLSPVLGQLGRFLEATKQNAVTGQMVQELESSVRAADLDYLLAEVPRALEQSLDGVRRVAKIVQAMKEFSHPGSEKMTVVDLNRAIESTITVARNEWKYVADVVTDFDPVLPAVPCLPGEFNQVILNLLINAAHAIGDVVGRGERGKGSITVSTRHFDDQVEVRIRDTGTGIPEAARSRIFDPFFTTKPVGKGTGQGLAIARSVIVDKHGGSIDFETEMGKGTTFIIRLPLCRQPPEKEEYADEEANLVCR